MSDPVRQFEHSHASLSKLALEAGQLLRELPRGLPAAMRRRRLAEHLKLFGNELLHHFAQEEEGLFPFIRENVPAKADTVDLVEGHDLICGAIVRLVHLVDSEAAADFATLVAHFERFEAAYARHSQAEVALFEELGPTLGATQRQTLAEFLRGL
jgi:iron-sulfur cluster repair protein YtfE (RIC family)